MKNLIILIIYCLFTLKSVITVSLYDLDLPPSSGIAHIQAVLTDKVTEEEWHLEQYLNLQSKVNGRTYINSDTESMVVYFDSRFKNKRQVFNNNFCKVITRENGAWDSMLPGIKSDLINDLMVLGPSVYIPLRDTILKWKTCETTEIRGTLLDCSKTIMNPNLNVSLYYQSQNKASPRRIEIRKYDDSVPNQINDVILDLYLIEYIEDPDKTFTLLEIGCPDYFDRGESTQLFFYGKYHYRIVESSKITEKHPYTIDLKMEAWVDADTEFAYFITDIKDIKLHRIYDYSVGIIYSFQNGCHKSAMKSDAPGVRDNLFYVSDLLWIKHDLQYVGEISGKHIWEATEYNVTINSVTYDKLVVTAYYAKTQLNKDGRFTLRTVTRTGYKKHDSGEGYTWVFSKSRDYYDFINDFPYNFYNLFQVADCYDDPDQQLNLLFEISYIGDKKTPTGLELAEMDVNVLKESIITWLRSDNKIYPSRVASIDFDFEDEKIFASIKLLKGPNFMDSFEFTIVKVAPEVHKQRNTYCENIQQYLDNIIKREEFSEENSPRTFIYCPSVKICFSVDSLVELKSDAESVDSCLLYRLNVGYLESFAKQPSLKEIHNKLIETREAGVFSIHYRGNFGIYQYRIDDILAISFTGKSEKFDQLFTLFANEHMLNSDNSLVTDVSLSVNDFGECFKLCKSGRNDKCGAFSFCQDETSFNCKITSAPLSELIEQNNLTQVNSSCSVYVKNVLLEFHEIPNQEFVSVADTSNNIFVKDECADKCFKSDQCHAFQFCDQGLCGLATYNESRNTKPAESCSTYTKNALNNFILTGSTLITEQYMEQLSVDLEICAALCFNDKQNCKSFNYCPSGKSESRCQLTEYTVTDQQVRTNSNVICRNYQLNSVYDNIKNSETANAVQSGLLLNRGSVFGIIITFLVLGSLFGIISQFVYTKIKGKKLSSNSDIAETSFTGPSDGSHLISR